MIENILVSGLINIETTLQIDRFPIDYSPARYPFHGIRSTISGVGFNIAKALTMLGNQVTLVSLLGQDPFESWVRQTLRQQKIPDRFVLASLEQTAQSVILYDQDGRRQINVDLKDIQEQFYPEALFAQAVADCSLVVLCNINFSRPFLAPCRQQGKWIATDVHTIGQLKDPYNQDFMRHAHILFMSDENLPCAPETWARQLLERYPAEILVIGLGAQGALLGVRRDNAITRVPAVRTGPVVNTIGAGDALFSAFVHSFNQTRDPYQAIRQAVIFASYKTRATGAADGFLNANELEALYQAQERQT